MKPHIIALIGAIINTVGCITLFFCWRIGLMERLGTEKEISEWQRAFFKTGIVLVIIGFLLEGISLILGP
jgi:hypothetical protein